MNNKTVSTDVVATMALWSISAVFVIAAWATYLTGHHELAIMLALTGGPVVAAAMTSQVRCYTRRVCGLVRATRLDGDDAGIRSLR